MLLTISPVCESTTQTYTNKATDEAKSYTPLAQEVKEQAVTIEKASAKSNLAKLKADGLYRPEEKFFFGLKTRKAQYAYKADGKESISEIKEKFGLKDGAISKCNSQIRDDAWIPPKDYEIYFYEEDANNE